MTADHFASLIGQDDLQEEDPPEVCVAPSTGRFEVSESCTRLVNISALFLLRPASKHRVSAHVMYEDCLWTMLMKDAKSVLMFAPIRRLLSACCVYQVTGAGSFNLSVVHHDKYSAYLVVCDRGGGFSGEVTSTFLNLAPEGGLTQHLQIQQAMLPALFTVSLTVLLFCVYA